MVFLLAMVGFLNTGDRIVPPQYADQSVPLRYRGQTILNKPRGFKEKVIALTFDDGPDRSNTPRIAKALEAAKGRGTFFVLGAYAERQKPLVKWVVDRGHVVGSHSYTHPARPSRQKAGPELWKTARAIYDATGQWPSIFRPPYGIADSWTARLAKASGYASVLWNKVGPDTARGATAATIANSVIRDARPGDIVLFHDGPGKEHTVRAVPKIVSALRKQGYEFVTVPELLRRWDEHEQRREAELERRKAAAEAKVNAPKVTPESGE